ncbi:hypothetical protein HS088_TW20G00257 [Tripterygium wilfordii]|uniref:Uncharacterized protein n=1 Tax=Tripterygium wilfordii TaxID=458696 RepID=A0A7J7C6Z3_TRIWF|nr:hypothetical protein HS088_TW20G00257 [Tripterygium wilfordii]
MAPVFSYIHNLISNDILSLLSIVFFTIFLLYSATKWSKSKNKSPLLPPGPIGLPLVGSLPFLDPELHSYFATLARSYGPIFKIRLGLKLGVVISSPTLAREVLKDHDITFANRDVPIVARTLTYGGTDIVWTPYGPEWRMLRKVCVLKMLSNTTLDSVYVLRRREVRETVGYLYSRSGSPVNFGEQVFLTILNVITSMIWGGTVKGEQQRASLGAEFRQMVAEMTELLGKPNISDFFPGLARFDLQGLDKKMKVLAQTFDRIFDMMIDQGLKMDKEGGKDFLHFLLRFKDEEEALTMLHMKALFMNPLVAVPIPRLSDPKLYD